jgi:hypothetical protein
VIGAASLNDEEFEMITIEAQAYTAELYTEVMIVLDSRESVSATRDRLTYYFQARGVQVTEPSAGISNIFLGSSL